MTILLDLCMLYTFMNTIIITPNQCLQSKKKTETKNKDFNHTHTHSTTLNHFLRQSACKLYNNWNECCEAKDRAHGTENGNHSTSQPVI